MTKKIKKTEYESLAQCIKTEQVPAEDIAVYFKDKSFYNYYKKNWLNK
jgi:hypothetical protein